MAQRTPSTIAQPAIRLLPDALHEWAQDSGLNWYALADAAQSAQIPHALGDEAHARSLFGAAWDSPLGRQSPWLVSLTSPDEADAAWRWLAREAPRQPATLSVFASRLAADEQLRRLQRCLDLVLPDGDEMVLGYWDPAILATLVGQADDETLHVAGPVLTPSQQSTLTHGMAGWWYWDRAGKVHQINVRTDAAQVPAEFPPDALPLTFTQPQLDALVEASVPDQVLYHVQLNQPLLLEPVPPAGRYVVIRDLVRQARAHGLETFRDLANFCCAGLIYGARMQTDPIIQALLQRLKSGERRWDDLMPEFPE